MLVHTELGPEEYELYLYSACMQITDVFVENTSDALLDRDALLDHADPDLSFDPVVVQFGKFLKIIVPFHEDTAGGGSINIQSEGAGPSAFDVMRQTMCEQVRVRTPSLS